MPLPVTSVEVMFNQRFGRALRQARMDLGLSQERLAEVAQLDRSYIGEIERGSVSPSLTTLVKLASALKLPPSVLLRRCEVNAVGATTSTLDGDHP